MVNGPLAGYPMDSLKVTLFSGSFHAVDSDALSFELAAKIGYKAACKSASPSLLEPIMKLEVVTPEANMGDVVADLNRRRGQVEGMDSVAGMQLYIHPDECIDCGACEPECPVDAIYDEDDLPEEYEKFIEINAKFFEE